MSVKKVLLIIIVLILGSLALVLKPIGVGDLKSHPQPEKDFQETLTKLNNSSQDDGSINPLCHSQFLTHGKKTAKVIVLLHGFTNCPEQFTKLGELLYDQGNNVFIPRIVHHGKKDRLTDDLKNLTAEELTTQTDQVINLAAGLGDQVTMVGLSGGGVMAAWAAQNRADVEKAIIIAPNFKHNFYLGYVFPQTNLTRLIPNVFIWWDDQAKENIAGPKYAYPRYPSYAVYEFFRLGAITMEQAQKTKPQAHSIIMVTNGADTAVNNAVTDDLITSWKKSGGTNISTYQFPATLNLGHDLIDPNQPYQKVETVYPELIKLINQN